MRRDLLPTPLAVSLRSVAKAADADRGGTIAFAFRTFSRWSLAVATSIYLRHGVPHRSINHELFGWIKNARMIHHHQMIDAICQRGGIDRTAVGTAFQQFWKRARQLEVNDRLVIDELEEFDRFFRHVQSTSGHLASHETLLELLIDTVAEFAEAYPVRGRVDQHIYQFSGGHPQRVDTSPSDGLEGGDVWLSTDEGPISLAFVEIEAGETPELNPLDETAVSKRVLDSIRSADHLKELHARYDRERNGEFDFETETVDLPPELAEWLTAQQVLRSSALIFHHVEARLLGSAVARFFANEGCRVVHLSFGSSLVAAKGLAFLRWLWRAVRPAEDDEVISKRDPIVKAIHSELLGAKQPTVIVLEECDVLRNTTLWRQDPLLPVLQELLTADENLRVVAVSPPVGPNDPWPLSKLRLRRMYCPDDVTESLRQQTEQVKSVEMIEGLPSRSRHVLECVAAAPGLSLHELGAVVSLRTPALYDEIQKLQPFWNHPRGLSDIDEGPRQLSFASCALEEIVLSGMNGHLEDRRQHAQEVLGRRREIVERRERMADRERPTRHD